MRLDDWKNAKSGDLLFARMNARMYDVPGDNSGIRTGGIFRRTLSHGSAAVVLCAGSIAHWSWALVVSEGAVGWVYFGDLDGFRTEGIERVAH